ncbi:MAG: methyltransferase [Ilumatobacteraceae bacterium]|nr:methyltransferase [Ilumatobacteraceae bacterium]
MSIVSRHERMTMTTTTNPTPTAPAASTFDPDRYKRTTHDQWQDAAEAWHRWGPFIDEWLGASTELMLDLAAVGTGARVLDVAAGAGGQTITAARRVGPTGSVLATDISANLLDYASREAARQGLFNVSTLAADGELLDVEAGSFDAAISRVGLIYFPDQQAALARMIHALRPGGRVVAIVYSTADRNEFFSIPVGIIRRRAELPPPAAGQPGPFSLGAPGVIESAFTAAGLVEVEAHVVPSPLHFPSAKECVRFERESFGALHQMLAGLDDAGRAAAWAEITDGLNRFETNVGFVGPCEMIVGVGTKCGPSPH